VIILFVFRESKKRLLNSVSVFNSEKIKLLIENLKWQERWERIKTAYFLQRISYL